MESENINNRPMDNNSGGGPAAGPDGILSFEQALVQLQELVKKMESGALPLADSVKAYEQGVKLKAYLEQVLKEAELKIEKLNIAD